MTKSKNKPMTTEEEYRNADVSMPNDMLNASNTQKFGLGPNFKEKLIDWIRKLKK